MEHKSTSNRWVPPPSCQPINTVGSFQRRSSGASQRYVAKLGSKWSLAQDLTTWIRSRSFNKLRTIPVLVLHFLQRISKMGMYLFKENNVITTITVGAVLAPFLRAMKDYTAFTSVAIIMASRIHYFCLFSRHIDTFAQFILSIKEVYNHIQWFKSISPFTVD